MKNNTVTKFWYAAAVVVVLSAGFFVYLIIEKRNTPIIYSTNDVLQAVWMKYKINYLDSATSRTVDPSKNFISTSEGESYTMLRSVWLDDHQTFDASWNWTKKTLQMKNSHIFSWLYGKKTDGTYGILTNQNGQNSASDADTDIALALLFAYSRWRQPEYLSSAQNIMSDIWKNEVIIISGKPYLAADNVEKQYSGYVAINPSYLAPYAYRIFNTVDTSHNWNGLIDTSYDVLSKSMSLKLDSGKSDGLPPDWVLLNRINGSIVAPVGKGSIGPLDTYYSYDALRVPWRLYLDWHWYGETRARDLLMSMNYLKTQWESAHVLNASYAHDGSVVDSSESSAMYGGSIAAFIILDKNMAKDIYEKKLINLFSPDSDSWRYLLGYYDDNWTWFGIALYNNALPNLWASVDSST